MRLHKLMTKLNMVTNKAPLGRVSTYISVTVAVNGVGHLHIDGVVYCPHCKEYHIQLGSISEAYTGEEKERIEMQNENQESTNFQTVEAIKADTVKLLITDHNYAMETASEAVETHASENPESWHVNSVANELANDIANPDDDE